MLGETDRFACGRDGLFLLSDAAVTAKNSAPSDGDGAKGAVAVSDASGVEQNEGLGGLIAPLGGAQTVLHGDVGVAVDQHIRPQLHGSVGGGRRA